MKFGIRGRGIELTEALLAHVERRLRAALSHFEQRSDRPPYNLQTSTDHVTD